MKKFLSSVLVFVAMTSVFASGHPDDIIGIWKAGGGKGHIQIFKQNGKYYGKIIWLRAPKETNGEIKLDRKNPDPALRTKPIIGLVLLRDFIYKGGEWTEGYVYNTADGKEYKSYMTLKDPNTLAVRGYMGFSWIGKTDTWVRVK